MEIKVLAFLLLYFLPTLLAPRSVRFEVLFANLMLGWTLIGWIWAAHITTEALRRKVC